jgi:16S rRNA (guanine527-N7)-methyltransferase
MQEVNKSLNLTAIKDEDGIILKHLVDSSACVPYIKSGAKLCDIGCGGGFPSLVIAILREDVSVLGVDSVAKKVKYVEGAAELLGLDNVCVSSRRAEELGNDKKKKLAATMENLAVDGSADEQTNNDDSQNSDSDTE